MLEKDFQAGNISKEECFERKERVRVKKVRLLLRSKSERRAGRSVPQAVIYSITSPAPPPFRKYRGLSPFEWR
jgi:hypothetical protein